MSSALHPSNDSSINPSSNNSILDVIEQTSPSRRKFLRGSVGGATLAAVTGMGLSKEALAYTSSPTPVGGIGFTPVPAINSATVAGSGGTIPVGGVFDAVIVPSGYKAEVLVAWGDAIIGAATPNMDPTVAQNEADQLKQFGMHVDGSHFFPFPVVGTTGESSERGLFCVNHEYTDEGLLHHDAAALTAPQTAARVRISQAAQGIAVVELRRTGSQWGVVKSSPFNRRITANTPMRIVGPAKGNAMMKTAADPLGEVVFGTINNCAAGYTPWGTYLTCEENFNGNFGAVGAFTANAHQARYGLNAAGFGYRWHVTEARFDMNSNPNESNRFGWVVEIDPFNPRSTPVKQTALGRFKHESVSIVVGGDNSVVAYMGDDERNEYIYKFVSSKKFIPGNNVHNRTILENGKLYVARFDADGTGDWLELTHGLNGLTAANGFADQAEVVIKCRQAADRVGATMMDRPEWVAVHPTTREVYITLTNNNRRATPTATNRSVHTAASGLLTQATGVTTFPLTAATARPPIDSSNPRSNNKYGHIIRWNETSGDVTSLTFDWEVFLLAGDKLGPTGTALETFQGNIIGDDFGAPDGLWFDRDGRLWIQTDQLGDAKGDWVNIGVNTMSCADPATRTVKRFLTSPPNCEVTGVTGTPDGKTLFVGIQHPGEDWVSSFTEKSSWPDNGRNGPTTLSSVTPVRKPRASILAITRLDGGVVGGL